MGNEERKKDSHFDSSLRGALLVDVIPKEVPLLDVAGRDGDHLDRDEETREAHSSVDEDRSSELRLDGIVAEEEIRVREQEEERELQKKTPFRRRNWRVCCGWFLFGFGGCGVFLCCRRRRMRLGRRESLSCSHCCCCFVSQGKALVQRLMGDFICGGEFFFSSV